MTYQRILAAGGVLMACMAVTAEAQQQDGQLTIYLATTYGLEADNHCQLMDYAQREAVAHMNAAMKGSLVQRYNREALEAEAKRIEGLAANAWTGCLSRADDAEAWKSVDSAILYGDALLAAPGAMSDAISSCAVGKDGAAIDRETFTALRGEVLAHYEGQARTQLEDLSASIADGMASQCLGNGYSADLKPVLSWKERAAMNPDNAAGQPTSLSTYGPWTGFRFFPFEGFDEFGVGAYRTGAEGTGRLAGVSLGRASAPNGDGHIYADKDGTLTAALSGAVASLEIRAEGMDPLGFKRAAQTSEDGFIVQSQFVLDADAVAALSALPPETPLGFFFQLSPGAEWRQYVNSMDRAGKLPVGRLFDAIEWASAPRPNSG